MARVVVIGAGAAGLAAARGIAAGGAPVTVLEAGARVGGRRAGATVAGARFDPTGALFSTADRHVLGLLAELGASERLRALGPGGLGQSFRGRVRAVDASSRLGVARIPGVGWLDALRLVRLDRLLARYRPWLDPDAPERAASLDDRSLRDFATLYFGRSVAERWIGPFATAGTGSSAADASRLLFLLRAGSHRAASLATLRGGVGRLLEDAASGLDVRLGTRVGGVARASDGGFEIRFDRGGAAGCERAEAVVFATPAPEANRLAGDLLTTAESDFLGSVAYAPGLWLALGLAGASFESPRRIQIPEAEPGPFEAVSLLPAETVHGLSSPAGVVVASARPAWAAAHRAAADDVVAKELAAALSPLVPGTGGEPIFREVTRREAAMPRFDAGQFRRLAGFRRVLDDRRREGRRLYFAGDYLAGPWLEAALGSGRRAAADLRADLGSRGRGPRSPAQPVRSANVTPSPPSSAEPAAKPST